jgi:hypothetical protein
MVLSVWKYFSPMAKKNQSFGGVKRKFFCSFDGLADFGIIGVLNLFDKS